MASKHSICSVLAVITHYQYEKWLSGAIESLLGQTRPPESIVVVDDASPVPPVDIVNRYAGVTLLSAEENVGPYKNLQAIFDHADHDAFLLQDADDWSHPDRLSTLLTAAQCHAAEMVGCQAISVYEDIPAESDISYPFDARAAVLENPIVHPILMATSLLSRALVQRVGGLATGLRFGADSEFVRRAIFAGRVINVDERLYFRRVHPSSLTQAADTGFGTPQRTAVQKLIRQQSQSNVTRVKRGIPPQLTPIIKEHPARLRHITGPRLLGI